MSSFVTQSNQQSRVDSQVLNKILIFPRQGTWGWSPRATSSVFGALREIQMNTLANIASRFREEEDGAAMVEYTVLLGIITVAVIATVAAVGLWVTNSWGDLCGKLTSGTACVKPS
jgi:pilus assembly protein Flp/PilA